MTHPDRFLRRAAALLLALALAAGGHAQEAPTPGGTLVIGIATSPGHLNPAISTGSEVHTVADSIFNGLVALDDQAVPQPELATSWSVNDDATVYTFTLADGVRWHDGAPFTSADVRFTFEEVLLRFHSRTRSSLGGRLARIDTPDDRTVAFHFDEPYAPLLQQLTVTEAPILPRHVYAEAADATTAAANLRPIGTGPFRFVAYDPDDQVVLERNDDYFEEGLPYLDRVVFRIVPDASTRLLALERGELDFVAGVPASEFERIAASPALTTYAPNSGPGGGFCVMTMTFNLERALLANRAVRVALAHAIDRQQLVDQVLYGSGRVATGPIHSGLANFYTDDVTAYAFDPARAARLLDEAGYPAGADGVRFAIDFLHFPQFAKYGEVLRQNLAEVGVRLELVALDRAAFVTRMFGQRDFDTGVVSYCNNTDPAIGVARVYLSSNIGDVPFSNAGAYANADVDRLFAEAASLAGIEARAERYRAVQRLLTADLPYLWLVESASLSASAAYVRGLAPWSGSPATRAWIAR